MDRTTINQNDHPSKDIIASSGVELLDRKIVLCITGSIAAYKAVDLARLLMRHGAEVYPVMSETSSSMLINSELMKWATGNEVVTKLTGKLEHISLADYGASDLVIVYPCTANTIGKMANGIDDTSVTSILSVAVGANIPVIICPAMHESMFQNKLILANVLKLKQIGINFLEPNLIEGKAKVADLESVVSFVIKKLERISRNSWFDSKKVLVTAGGTVEYIDPLRVISNLSSGKTGISIAREAERRGADVTLIFGHGSTNAEGLRRARIINVDTSNDMLDAVTRELSSSDYDVGIFAAAVSDYTPADKSNVKLKSDFSYFDLRLSTTKKIIDEVRELSKKIFSVGFKAEYNIPPPVLIQKAYERLKKARCDIMVANDVGIDGSRIGSDTIETHIVDTNKNVIHTPIQDKPMFAKLLLDIIEEKILQPK
ncbi:MAG TPA: bifunctional phosphopantothenoylcysteine decarboxylase/phosphopantothenate--cysteine ligase CoaBC [Nitrososphaeraceae archaeon]|jgi:phosphopantothenoylcysteine decarboxylase/phosphopantothenate--cysteine ligase